MDITGAQAVIRSLETEGVEVIFGHPGGAILPAYDPLLDSPVRHVLARHEQGAGHMAEGYAHATGRVGVVLATSGPGATNLVTALADAHCDSVPLVAITGQVPTGAVGGDAFQEADITGITMPVTKHNEMVTDAGRIPGAIKEAFHIAATGRPGPVLVDIPKDVLTQRCPFRWPDRLTLPGYRPTLRGHPKMVREAARSLLAARRPVLYVGGGTIRAAAHDPLRRLAEMLRLPVVTTLTARGAFPDSHPQHLGMPGMHGHWTAVTALQRSDLLLALGARFDDRVTGKLSAFAPGARIVHVDIDPAEIGKHRAVDVPIVGDCREVGEQLVAAVSELLAAGETPADLSPWWATLDEWRRAHPLRVDQQLDGPLKPQTVIRAIGQRLPGDGIVVTGVGQHQMWAAQHIAYERPRSWINSGGLGTMGFCVPAAIGAKIGRPDDTVVAIDGDGSFQMTLQELATARTEHVPVVFCVINNGALGMVRQWQELFYGGRWSSVDLGWEVPDLVKLADAFGCAGLRCERPEDVESTLDKAFAVGDVPVVVDFRVDVTEKVFPMVPAGASNDEIVESAQEWYAKAAAGVPGGSGEPGGAALPASMHEGDAVQGAPGATAPAPRQQVEGRGSAMATHTVSVLVEDRPGVLARVAGLFSRRGFNIESLAVGPTEVAGVSRMTIVVDAAAAPLEQVTKQLNKLVHVLKIVELERDTAVERELQLIKVGAAAGTRSQVIEVASVFRANVVDVDTETLTLEVTGSPEKLAALVRLLEPYGIRELVRSGMIAVGRGARSITDGRGLRLERGA